MVSVCGFPTLLSPHIVFCNNRMLLALILAAVQSPFLWIPTTRTQSTKAVCQTQFDWVLPHHELVHGGTHKLTVSILTDDELQGPEPVPCYLLAMATVLWTGVYAPRFY